MKQPTASIDLTEREIDILVREYAQDIMRHSFPPDAFPMLERLKFLLEQRAKLLGG